MNNYTIKKVSVKVESIKTGEIVSEHDCGTNERKAERLERALSDRVDTKNYHVYISYEV